MSRPSASGRDRAGRRSGPPAAVRGTSISSVGQAGSAKTSAGGPSRTIRPSRMTTTRSNASATNRMSWLIATTVRPPAPRSDTIRGRARCPARPGPLLARRGSPRACPSRGSRRGRGLPARVAEVVRVRLGVLVEPGRDQRRPDRSVHVRAAPAEVPGTEGDLRPDLPREDLAVGVLDARPTIAAR